MTRADRLAERLRERELDALLVSDLVNLRYLTGFTGSNGFAVVGEGLRRFVTDFRYVTQAAAQVQGFDREEGPRELLGALAEGWPGGELRLGFEDHVVSVKTHGRLRELLPERRRYGDTLYASKIGNARALVCAFSHPSARGELRWGDRLDSPYLNNVVAPTIRRALRRL